MRPDEITIKDIYEEIYKIASKTREEEDSKVDEQKSTSEMISPIVNL